VIPEALSVIPDPLAMSYGASSATPDPLATTHGALSVEYLASPEASHLSFVVVQASCLQEYMKKCGLEGRTTMIGNNEYEKSERERERERESRMRAFSGFGKRASRNNSRLRAGNYGLVKRGKAQRFRDEGVPKHHRNTNSGFAIKVILNMYASSHDSSFTLPAKHPTRTTL